MARKVKNGITQNFSLTAPTATSVLLAGDFTHWQKRPIPMTKATGDLWQATVDLGPGTHRYRFIVDGQWRDDPDCTLRVPNPFGTEDGVRNVA
jgi:1,4-alpha-glucan branching enzyme